MADFRDPTDPESRDYFAIGADELDELSGRAPADAGDRIQCPRCRAPHVLSRTANLLFYRCGHASFLAGVDARLIDGLELAEVVPPI
jgi:hypothetical protein